MCVQMFWTYEFPVERLYVCKSFNQLVILNLFSLESTPHTFHVTNFGVIMFKLTIQVLNVYLPTGTPWFFSFSVFSPTVVDVLLCFSIVV